MKGGVLAWFALIAAQFTWMAPTASAHSLRVLAGASDRQAVTSEALSTGEPSKAAPVIYSNTTLVRGMVTDGKAVWVATSGGLEKYNLNTHQRVAVYSTNDGLPSLDVYGVKLASHGVVVSVAGHDCAMPATARGFSCSQRNTGQQPNTSSQAGGNVLAVGATGFIGGEPIEGSSVTSRVAVGDSEWLGTSGLGVWVRRDGKLSRVTPTHQIASNHVVAISEWNGSTWFATFDHGLSVLQDGQFFDVALTPRMLNDVIGTKAGLFVATSEGLFTSDDGESFRRDMRVPESSITDLAYDVTKQILYVTATNSLWEVDLGKPRKYARSTYQPGGTRSLQAVDVSPDGTVFLASEDRGVLRRDGHRRYTSFDRLAGYPSSWVIDVLALSEQDALGGTLRHGMFSTHRRLALKANVDSWILFLGRDVDTKDTVFVGTQGGAAIIRGEQVQTLEGLPHSCVHTMARLHDGLWVGTEGGLARYQ